MSDSFYYIVWYYKTRNDNKPKYLRAYKLERHALLFARGAAAVGKYYKGQIYVEYPLGYFVEVK